MRRKWVSLVDNNMKGGLVFLALKPNNILQKETTQHKKHYFLF